MLIALLLVAVAAGSPSALAAGDEDATYRYERKGRIVIVEGWASVPVEYRDRARKVDLSPSRSNSQLATDLAANRPTAPPPPAALDPCAATAGSAGAATPAAKSAVASLIGAPPQRLALLGGLAIVAVIAAVAFVRWIGFATWLRASLTVVPLALIALLSYLSIKEAAGRMRSASASRSNAPCVAREAGTDRRLEAIDRQLRQIDGRGR